MSVIKTYWLKTLVKINMGDKLLGVVLPLLCDQLEDITGDWYSCFTADGNTVSMPRLKRLDVHGTYYASYVNISGKSFDALRIAYPKLEQLTLREFNIVSDGNDENQDYEPYPLVRSLHILDCTQENALLMFLKLFTDLHEYSLILLRSGQHLARHRRRYIYTYEQAYTSLVVTHPNIRYLRIGYVSDDGMSVFKTLSILKRLTSLRLEVRVSSMTPCYIHVRAIMTYFFVGIKKLEIFNTNQEDSENLVAPVNSFDTTYQVFPTRRLLEMRYQEHILTIPHLNSVVKWQSNNFKWLALNYPLLQELYVVNIRFHRGYMIRLGKHVNTFSLSLDRIFDVSNPPIVCLCYLTCFVYNKTDCCYQVYPTNQTILRPKIYINHSKLKKLRVCGHSIPNV